MFIKLFLIAFKKHWPVTFLYPFANALYVFKIV